MDVSVILLHDEMVDKNGRIVTTSITLIDVHDVARVAKTYGLSNAFVAHPSPALRALSNTLKTHWEEGYGATYNPNRKDALGLLEIVKTFDEAIEHIQKRTGVAPKLIATSAKESNGRIGFKSLRDTIASTEIPYLIMIGTGWGMSEALLEKADYFLEPIKGKGDYNHLSVRAACGIIVDRLLGE